MKLSSLITLWLDYEAKASCAWYTGIWFSHSLEHLEILINNHLVEGNGMPQEQNKNGNKQV